jgi:hypothetical protein
MNTCQHCQTELNNSRARNCKTCSDLLTDSYKNNAYDLVTEALTEAKKAGLAGTEIHNIMREAIQAGRQRNNNWINDYRKRLNQRREEDSYRIQFFQKYGYYPNQIFDGEDVRIDIEDGRHYIPATGAGIDDK